MCHGYSCACTLSIGLDGQVFCTLWCWTLTSHGEFTSCWIYASSGLTRYYKLSLDITTHHMTSYSRGLVTSRVSLDHAPTIRYDRVYHDKPSSPLLKPATFQRYIQYSVTTRNAVTVYSTHRAHTYYCVPPPPPRRTIYFYGPVFRAYFERLSVTVL